MSDIHNARLIPFNDTLAKYLDNPDFIPRAGEICVETGGITVKMKLGDGITPYLDLPYAFTGGGGGGTPTLAQTMDYTTLGPYANVSPFELFIGDFNPSTGGTNTGFMTDGADVQLLDNNVPYIGFHKTFGGPTYPSNFFIFDTVYEKYVRILAPEISSGDTEIEVKLPDEDGDIPVADGTKILKVSSTMSLNSDHQGQGYISRNGTTAMTGAITMGTEGFLFVRKSLITQLDFFKSKNNSIALRNFSTPSYVVGDRDLSVAGNGTNAPVVSNPGGGTGYTVTLLPGSDDVKGVIQLATGAGGMVVSGQLARFTFFNPYDIAPSVAFTPVSNNSAQVGIPYIPNSGNLFFDFMLNQGPYGAYNPSSFYHWMYSVTR